MQEIILSILQAEQRAAQLKESAEETARKRLQDSEIRVEEIQAGAVDVVKAYRKSELGKAETLASKEYDAIVANGEIQAKAKADEAKTKVEETADLIVKEILG